MNKHSEKPVIKIFIVLITLFITVHISHAQILCNEGYPNCETTYRPPMKNGHLPPQSPVTPSQEPTTS